MWSCVRLIIIVSICGTPLEAIVRKGLAVYLDGVRPISCPRVSSRYSINLYDIWFCDMAECRVWISPSEEELLDLPDCLPYPDTIREMLASNYEETHLINSTGHMTYDSFREALEKENALDTVEGFIMLRRMKACEFVNDLVVADGRQGVLDRAELIHECSRIRQFRVSCLDFVIRWMIFYRIICFFIKCCQYYDALQNQVKLQNCYHLKHLHWGFIAIFLIHAGFGASFFFMLFFASLTSLIKYSPNVTLYAVLTEVLVDKICNLVDISIDYSTWVFNAVFYV